MTTSQAPELIGLAQRTLRDLRLRVAGARGGGPDALREAGYAGAGSLFDAFDSWLGERGSTLLRVSVDGVVRSLRPDCGQKVWMAV